MDHGRDDPGATGSARSDRPQRLRRPLGVAPSPGDRRRRTGALHRLWHQRTAARAAHAIVGEALPDATLASRDAFEVRLAPPRGGLVVAISHEAGTPATLDAGGGASAAGAQVVLVTTQIAARPQRHEEADRLAAVRRVLVVGSGVDEITAAELALKVEEAAHVPTTPLGAEKVLHGHLPAADRDTRLVLLRFDRDHRDERDGRSADVAASAGVLGMPTVALGTNPDLIRRDDPLYRRVAEAAGAG